MSRRQETEFVRISAVKLLTLHACRLICLMTIGKILGQSNPSLMPIWLLQHRYSILLSSSILCSLVVWLHISTSFNTHEVFCIGLAACQLQFLWCEKADLHIPSIITPYKNRKMPGIYFVNIKGIFPEGTCLLLALLSWEVILIGFEKAKNHWVLDFRWETQSFPMVAFWGVAAWNIQLLEFGLELRMVPHWRCVMSIGWKCLQSSSLGVLDCSYQSCIVHKHIQ